MIPKKVHYFWFSGEAIPKKLQNCLDSWTKALPDYTFKKWDLSNSPIDCAFAKKALNDQKWAFITDYCRFKVLYSEGGIYIDTDVFLLKDFNELLNYDSFWSSTDFNKVDPFIFGSKPDNPILKKCIEFYENINLNFETYPVVPDVIASVFKSKGYEGQNELAFLFENNIILPYSIFCPMPFQKSDEKDFLKFAQAETIGIHLWNTSWNDPFRFFYQNRRQSGWKAVRKEILKNPIQSFEFYWNILYHLKCGLIGYPKK